MTEDEMVGWHHRLNGHAFEQAVGDGEGQGSLACCSPGGLKELDMTERLNNRSNGRGLSAPPPPTQSCRHVCKTVSQQEVWSSPLCWSPASLTRLIS